MSLMSARKSWDDWPHIKESRGGTGWSLSCRCMTVPRWVALRRLGFVICTLLGIYLMLVASMGLWASSVADAVEGTQGYVMLMRMVSLRWMLKDILVDQYPEIGAAILYDHRRPIDWHLLAAGMLLVVFRGPLTSAGTGIASVLLRPIVVPSLKISADADRIRIRRGLFSKTIRRTNGYHEARFRAVSVAEYFPNFSPDRLSQRPMLRPMLDTPPAVIELTSSVSRRKLLFVRRGDQAEAIAARGNELLTRTSDHPGMPGT